MFASGNHTVMGSAEDPKDGKSVATAVFGAVIIYGVSSRWKPHPPCPLEAGRKLRSDESKLTAPSSSSDRSSSSSAAARHYSTRDRQQVARSRCGRRSRSRHHERRTAFGKASKREMLHRWKGRQDSAWREAIIGVAKQWRSRSFLFFFLR